MEEENNVKKTSKVVPTLIIIFLLIVIGVLCLYSFTDVFKTGTINNNSNPAGDNSQESNGDNGNGATSNETKYMNYTSLDDIRLTYNQTMALKKNDDALVITINGEEIDINGIEGKVKSFIVGNDCGGLFRIVVLTDRGVFIALTMDTNKLYNKEQALTFSKLKSDEEIKDITKRKYAGETTCGDYDTAVVLKNGEIRLINTSYMLGNLDYNKVKTSVGISTIYADNTISKLIDGYDGPIETKTSYNNQELKISKYFSVADNTHIDNPTATVYIISDNKLYKIETKPVEGNKAWWMGEQEVTLVNESEIASENMNMSAKSNDVSLYYVCPYDENFAYYDNATDTITFKDGSEFKIENITEIYTNK